MTMIKKITLKYIKRNNNLKKKKESVKTISSLGRGILMKKFSPIKLFIKIH